MRRGGGGGLPLPSLACTQLSVQPMGLWCDEEGEGEQGGCAPTPADPTIIVSSLSSLNRPNCTNHPNRPTDQVTGDGQPLQKRPPPGGQAIRALAWSSDSFQLASLDAGSTLRMWFMRQSPGESWGTLTTGGAHGAAP